MQTYLLIAGIFVAAGFTQGFTGFGSALVALPLLVLFIDIKTAIPLCSLNGLLITGFLALRLRRHIDRKKIAPLLVGSLPGIFIGASLLKKADPGLMKILLSGLLISYALYRLLGKNRAALRPHPFWSYVAGFATGIIGSAFSAGGPPVIIYTTLTGWRKNEIKATLSGFFLVSTMFIVVAHAVNGLTTGPVLISFAAAAPGVLVGVISGSKLYDRVDSEEYLRLLYFCLLALGLMMLTTSL
jgi:hypothetical protein